MRQREWTWLPAAYGFVSGLSVAEQKYRKRQTGYGHSDHSPFAFACLSSYQAGNLAEATGIGSLSSDSPRFTKSTQTPCRLLPTLLFQCRPNTGLESRPTIGRRFGRNTLQGVYGNQIQNGRLVGRRSGRSSETEAPTSYSCHNSSVPPLSAPFRGIVFP
jgi:hypothetical protein